MKIKDNYKTDYGIAKYFVGNEYKIIILPHNNDKPQIYVSFNDEPYKAMIDTGYSMSSGKIKYSFKDIMDKDKPYELFYDNNNNNNNGMLKSLYNFEFVDEYKIDDDFLDIDYIHYPNDIIIESAYIDPATKKIFVVTRPDIDWDYNSFVLKIVNHDNNIESIKCKTVERYRDGGTTYYYTDDGTLFSPTPFDKEKPYTWTDGNGIIELDKLEDPYNYLGEKIVTALDIKFK